MNNLFQAASTMFGQTFDSDESPAEDVSTSEKVMEFIVRDLTKN